MSKRAQLAWYWLRSWVVSMALWLLLTSTVTPNEVITGLGAAAVAASAATLVHAAEPVSVTPRLAWVRYLVAVPIRVIADTAMLAVALLRHLAGRRTPGRFVEVETPALPRAGDRRAMEALATIAVGVAPNYVVVGFDEERGVALVHRLVPAGGQDTLDEVLRRL